MKKNSHEQLFKFKKLIRMNFEKLKDLLNLYEKEMNYSKYFKKLNDMTQ